MLRRSAFLFVASAAIVTIVAGHVRLLYSANGNPLYWDSPTSIPIVINSAGSDDIVNGSHETAIRSGIAEWNDVGQNHATLVEDKAAASQARTDWASNNLHLVMFDETNSSGYFPGSSGIVAVTPIEFFTTGEIIDADVLFNGKNFSFTTAGQLGRFDVQDVVTHELGHFLGLDHSGCAGATMYPYVDSTVILHRSLSMDDKRGLQSMYPNHSFGQIQGAVTRATNGSVVIGAHVVARDANGRFAAATLTNDFGTYTLSSLPAGTYTVYADPLDQPVSGSNLGGGQTIQTNFESTVLGTVAVTGGATATLGTQDVGANVPVSLGRVADDYPLRVIAGVTSGHIVRGAGLDSGSTLTASDPSIAVTPGFWFGGSVSFDVDAPALAASGHVDLIVTTALGDVDILPGALEITPPDPTVSLVSPASGSPSGGTTVTISGTGFNAGARVVIGNRVYTDGEPSGCTVVDDTTITLTTTATIGGSHDVVVIDPSGVEGRGSGAFTVAVAPTVASVFPAAGESNGGTTVVLTGSNFVSGCVVDIDSVVQSNVSVHSPELMSFVTAPGTVGGLGIVTITNPGGYSSSVGFTYVTKPDPDLINVSPGSGSVAGGETVQIIGDDFTTDTVVIFGADPNTGLGGQPAAQISLVNTGLIAAMTPASSSTRSTVLVRESDTGQAAILNGAFEFIDPNASGPSDDSGMGGCGVVAPRGPSSPMDVASGAGWIVLAALLLSRRRQRLLAGGEAAPLA